MNGLETVREYTPNWRVVQTRTVTLCEGRQMSGGERDVRAQQRTHPFTPHGVGLMNDNHFGVCFVTDVFDCLNCRNYFRAEERARVVRLTGSFSSDWFDNQMKTSRLVVFMPH